MAATVKHARRIALERSVDGGDQDQKAGGGGGGACRFHPARKMAQPNPPSRSSGKIGVSNESTAPSSATTSPITATTATIGAKSSPRNRPPSPKTSLKRMRNGRVT